MTSVDRVAEFGRLEREDLEAKKTEPEESWPSRGDLEYEGVSLLYPAPPSADPISSPPEPPKAVLQNLSFRVRGGEKIGIVGRTGKLFRPVLILPMNLPMNLLNFFLI